MQFDGELHIKKQRKKCCLNKTVFSTESSPSTWKTIKTTEYSLIETALYTHTLQKQSHT